MEELLTTKNEVEAKEVARRVMDQFGPGVNARIVPIGDGYEVRIRPDLLAEERNALQWFSIGFHAAWEMLSELKEIDE